MMRLVLGVMMILMLAGGAIAQGGGDSPKGKRGKGMGKGKPSGYVIMGQVVEASSGAAIDYATVSILDKKTQKAIDGTTTGNGGIFRLRTASKEVSLEVSFIGYAPITIETLSFEGRKADLGVIKLGEDATMLDEIVLTAEKSTTEFKLDKRVFNVGKDLSTTGASALEVLNNVPSVNVDIEGSVTLRGSSGVQILINGKPSIMADDGNGLGTITADMIQSVEVITNPSAKYDAEGTSGIINIVLKKNEKKGLNGSITLNTGIPHNHSVGVSLNKRTENFNLFTQLGVGYKERKTLRDNLNKDFISERTVSSTGDESRNEKFYNLVLGSDYYINPTNIITLSGRYAYEIEDQPSINTFDLTDDQLDTLVKQWSRTEITDATNPKLQYELKYKRDFTDHKEHKLLFSAIGRYFGKKQSSVFTEQILSGIDDVFDQTTDTEFKEGKYTFNLDYTKPLSEHWTIETGAQYLDNIVSNDYTVSNEENGVFVVDSNFTNLFEYDQKVFGVYGTSAYEGDVWGIKIGLRAENTALNTLLTNTNEENDRNFTNLFPSAHTSYKLSERISLQAGYSRRIYRPRLWDLNPFFNVRNTFSIRSGNPRLDPEFTDSYEIGSIFIYEKISFNVNVYNRFTTDKIERVSIFSDNVSVLRPENVGTSNTTGVEFNFKYAPTKKITFNGDANYNYFVRKGTFSDQDFDFSNDQWSTKLTSKVKVNKTFDFEVTGRYRSEVQTVQGVVSDMLFADLGMRYKILKGKVVLNLSVRDVFASRVRESILQSDEFFAQGRGQLGRFVSLGFSYGFGKGEAMRYGGGGGRRP